MRVLTDSLFEGPTLTKIDEALKARYFWRSSTSFRQSATLVGALGGALGCSSVYIVDADIVFRIIPAGGFDHPEATHTHTHTHKHKHTPEGMTGSGNPIFHTGYKTQVCFAGEARLLTIS